MQALQTPGNSVIWTKLVWEPGCLHTVASWLEELFHNGQTEEWVG